MQKGGGSWSPTTTRLFTLALVTSLSSLPGAEATYCTLSPKPQHLGPLAMTFPSLFWVSPPCRGSLSRSVFPKMGF